MELETYLRFVLALVFVLALIGLLAWVARRYGFGGRVTSRPGRTRRLDIVETRTVDGKRRLVLLRRDDVEHLILTGPNSELLIEQGIEASVTAGAAPMDGPMDGRVDGPGDGPMDGRQTASDSVDRSGDQTSTRVSGNSTVFKGEVSKSLSKTKRRRAAKA